MNIPVAAADFVGRETELTEITRLLWDTPCRLLTLVGPGGIGKTRLALEAAAQFPVSENVYFVVLQPLASAEFVVTAIADSVGLQFYSGGDPKQQLLDYLREKSWLLVLDNFEHLLDGATLLSEILANAPDVRLLVTSRERLNLVEEWVLEVGGLAYPLDESDSRAEGYSAVELFVARARQAKVGFRLSGDSLRAVVRICRLVDGMPLGIELAASWVRALSCEAIADEIERSLDILETPARNIEPRHRTMRAAFAPTWERLSENERNVFMRLAVFRGGFTREAAERVAGASLHTLTSLIDKTLLRVDSDGRYDLQELLRQFAADKLEQVGEVALTADCHLQYFMRLAEQAETYEYSGERAIWHNELVLELDNLRVALAFAVENKQAEEGLRLAGALGWFWDAACLGFEGVEWLTRVLAIEQNVPATVRAKALNRVGEIGANYSIQGALTFLQEALTLARSENDTLNIAWALAGLGCQLMHFAKDTEAIPMLDESLRLFRELDDPLGMSHVLRRRASGAIRSGDYMYASLLLEEALTNAREAGAKNPAACVLYIASRIPRLQNNDFDLCATQLQAALALCREINDLSTMVAILKDLGAVEHLRGNDAQAVTHYEEALALIREFRRFKPNEGAGCLAGLGTIAAAQGKLEAAVRLFAVAELHHDGSLPFKGMDNQRETLRIQLGETRFAAVWSEGLMMTQEQIIAYALQSAAFPVETTPFQQETHQVSSEAFSARELEVLRLIAEGFSNREIADQLVLANSTIKWYVRQIFSKLEANSRTKAIVLARELGLVS